MLLTYRTATAVHQWVVDMCACVWYEWLCHEDEVPSDGTMYVFKYILL